MLVLTVHNSKNSDCKMSEPLHPFLHVLSFCDLVKSKSSQIARLSPSDANARGRNIAGYDVRFCVSLCLNSFYRALKPESCVYFSALKIQ